MEKVKYVKGFENLYVVSDRGVVYSLRFKKPLKPRKKKNGYLEVKLSCNGLRKFWLLHRLVAEHFIDNPSEKPEVNHIDGDKENNRIGNLEWVTSSENQKHAFATGLQKPRRGRDHVQSIPVVQMDLRGNVLRCFESIKSVKRELGFNTFGIIKCCKKEEKYKTAYGYKWAYKDKR